MWFFWAWVLLWKSKIQWNFLKYFLSKIYTRYTAKILIKSTKLTFWNIAAWINVLFWHFDAKCRYFCVTFPKQVGIFLVTVLRKYLMIRQANVKLLEFPCNINSIGWSALIHALWRRVEPINIIEIHIPTQEVPVQIWVLAVSHNYPFWQILLRNSGRNILSLRGFFEVTPN